jgi:glutathione synthase/RimK-type ligase-like ATP-grasp enzyme
VTVLLWGSPMDPVLDAVARACTARGLRTVTADSDTISLGLDGDLCTITGQREHLRAMTGALVRPQAALTTREAAKAYHLLNAWTELADACVMNRPAAAATNRSKPFQLALIAAAGFATPDTLVTTDPECVREFWAHHGRVIYKSVSGIRSIVAELHAHDEDRIEDVAACPTQFQQYVDGIDYRVHVVDDLVLACRITSDATDYRYAATSGGFASLAACQLPPDVASRCVELTRGLGLRLAGVDLRLDASGEWWCFEVNTAPGFIWFEQQTGLPIAATIAETLAGRSSSQSSATTTQSFSSA